MAIRYVISDWSGSFVPEKDAGPLWRHVGNGLRDAALRRGRLLRLGELAVAKYNLGGVEHAYREGLLDEEQREDAMYAVLNKAVLEGERAERVRGLMAGYGRAEGKRLDGRLVGPLSARLCSGDISRLTIVSGGSKDAIEAAVAASPWRLPNTTVYANALLSRDGRVVRFGDTESRYYQKRVGLEFVLDVPKAERRSIGCVVSDERDWESAERANQLGARIIASFHASPEFKEHVASRYKAMIPESAADLLNFLSKG